MVEAACSATESSSWTPNGAPPSRSGTLWSGKNDGRACGVGSFVKAYEPHRVGRHFSAIKGEWSLVTVCTVFYAQTTWRDSGEISRGTHRLVN